MYTILKQKRKSFSISINDHLEVIVKVPHNMKDKNIKELVQKYELWIQETLQKKRSQKEKHDWLITRKILYLGEYKKVRVIKSINRLPRVVLTQEELIINADLGDEDEKIRGYIENFYKKEAKKLLTTLADKYAKILQVQYKAITIRKQKTRWGSCSAKGGLSFNVKIMCAPIEMIEYVAVHEVMHLRHFNHGNEFWSAIAQIMPDYQKRRDYFRSYGESFRI